MDPLDFRLINEFQRNFPLDPAPFAGIARCLDTGEETVLTALRRLHAAGIVSRVGAVFAPRRLGASTLAAMIVPARRLEEIAASISARPEVNHNYEREHRYNLWFVVNARDETQLAGVLAAIERDTGCRVISLPLEHEFYIDLGFDLAGARKVPHAGRRIEATDLHTLTAAEHRLMGVLQHGIELVPQPFARLGAQAGMDEQAVIATLEHWRRDGLLKRFGIVVRHHELGYTANAMVVWDLPDAEANRAGSLLAAAPEVTLCYKRRRHLPQWPYNLFCMIHGRDRNVVERAVEDLRRRLDLERYPHAVLFSRLRFKQRGARYVAGATTHE
ncbi:AsnC family transcriptional regulator [Steroidobacter denitrificans]|uniref:siroheme decarboxylase n=1 Tax=Steroidobacter denitrificans TaxID=465721 RepID=A0A127FA11_STEDE|nr:Lrp/AsnC family transcriptional regulator [Steroidobacter denitrificans]AMN47254.1 AsnC family transcriptional regulator [Steroidobacter denitrificans]